MDVGEWCVVKPLLLMTIASFLLPIALFLRDIKRPSGSLKLSIGVLFTQFCTMKRTAVLSEVVAIKKLYLCINKVNTYTTNQIYLVDLLEDLTLARLL